LYILYVSFSTGLHCESFTNITLHEGYAILNLASYQQGTTIQISPMH